MCLEDYAIGQATLTAQIDLSAVSADQQLIGPDPGRCLLVVGQPSVGVIWVTTGMVAAAGNGFSVAPGQAPLILSSGAVGNLPSKAWRVICIGGPCSLSLWTGDFSMELMRSFRRGLDSGTYNK